MGTGFFFSQTPTDRLNGQGACGDALAVKARFPRQSSGTGLCCFTVVDVAAFPRKAGRSPLEKGGVGHGDNDEVGVMGGHGGAIYPPFLDGLSHEI